VRVVIALGGNALAKRGEPLDVATQRHNVRAAATAVAELARAHDVVVTHGNGPQVGFLALQAQVSGQGEVPPLDVLDAETEGMIGYWIEQELANLLPGRDVATLLTQVEVDPDDPAFDAPTKPIGPVYDAAEARALAARWGWRVAPDGAGFRRVVPSPEPRAIRERRTIELLVRAGVGLVCAGGGGIPVVRRPDGTLRGVEAVIDKDLSAALLASRLGAAALLLLTDVPAVFSDWPEPARQALRRTTPRRLRRLRFDPGSMGPKVEAACRFVDAGGPCAGIGALEDAARVLAGEAGTRVEPESQEAA
jgi:carbamate kinase